MNLEERLRILEVQGMTTNEKMWELTRRIARIENAVTDHILTPSRNSVGMVGTEPGNFEQLYQKISALAFEFNGILPALAEVIRVNGSQERMNVPPRNPSNARNNAKDAGINNQNHVASFQSKEENQNGLITSNVSRNLTYFEQPVSKRVEPINVFSTLGHPGERNSNVPWNATSASVGNNIETHIVSAPLNAQTAVLVNNNCRYNFSDENKDDVPATVTNFTSETMIHLLDPLPLHPSTFSKDKNGGSKDEGNNIYCKTNVAVTNLPPPPIKEVVYHKNPWGDELEDIGWEGTNNACNNSEIQPQFNDRANLTYNAVQASSSSDTTSAQSHSIPELPESSAPKAVLSYAGVTSKLPPAAPPTNAAVSKQQVFLSAESFFNDYMKRDTAQKVVRKEWVQKKLQKSPEAQKAGIVRAISRFALKQATKGQLSGMGHLLDIMIGDGIISQEKVLKCFCEGVISDLPNIFSQSQALFADVVSRVASILVTTFNDTMKDLDWLVCLGKCLYSKQPQLCYGFCYKVLMVILERKKYQGALKLWNQTGPGREILDAPAVTLSLKS